MTIQLLTAALISTLVKNQSIIPAANIYEGRRDKNITMPCICVELGSDRVVEYSFPYEKIIQVFKVWVFVQSYNKDHQITDDGYGSYGIGTMVNNLKLALTADSGNPNQATLNGQPNVYDVKIPSYTPGNVLYPVLHAILNVEVFYRQVRSTRT
jgi:hypothetical protein